MTPAPEMPAVQPVKRRRCLRCQTPFDSAWAGERVCTPCKGTQAWKSGESLRSVPSRSSAASRGSGGAS